MYGSSDLLLILPQNIHFPPINIADALIMDSEASQRWRWLSHLRSTNIEISAEATI
jgi:hypothetical protein